MGSSSASYGFQAVAVGRRTSRGAAAASFAFAAAPTGRSVRAGKTSAQYGFRVIRSTGDNGIVWPDDRFRVIVQESRTGEIVCRDLNVTNLVMQRALSAGCDIQFDVNLNDDTAEGIYFKPWRQLIHIEKAMQGKRRIWCSAIVAPSQLDEKTGVLHLKAKGFAAYPKQIPWLQDLNWIANDAYEPVVEIWKHLQEDFPNGDLGVEVFPTRSGVIMLPGYAYDGASMSLNFFATFVRASDKVDCGDYIDALARSIPFDYAERSQWNADRTDIIKKIELGTPRLGVIQDKLAFVQNENVSSMKPHTESQMDWVSDIGIAGFWPGFQYSAELANADPMRVRRYLDETDTFVDSNERAAAWAKRRLARRQTPAYWETITVDMDHPNAPFGTYDVGDTIAVSGFMPMVGELTHSHKIIAISVDAGKNICQLTLKAEGMFNYDRIFFPDGSTNIVDNAGFDFNLSSWLFSGPGWGHDASQGHARLGSARITADGSDHDLYTQPFGVSDFKIFPLAVSVKTSRPVPAAKSGAVQLVAQFYDDDTEPTSAVEVARLNDRMGTTWQRLKGTVMTPLGSSKVALRVHVDGELYDMQVWVDDAEVVL